MAYRQLSAVAFVVLGLVSTGCGKGTTLGAADADGTSDTPPASADDSPPSGADDAPPNSDDTPPASADDAPPTNPGAAPGGGALRELCEDACEVLTAIAECQDGEDIDPMAREICSNNGCAEAANTTEVIPCLAEIEGLFNCFANLPNICMPTEQQQAQCQGDAMAFSACAGEQEPPIDEPTPTERCTMEMGCQCLTDCASCQCALGPDGAAQCASICETGNL